MTVTHNVLVVNKWSRSSGLWAHVHLCHRLVTKCSNASGFTDERDRVPP